MFALYDDDGVSYDYEKGKGGVTTLTWHDATGVLSASGEDKALVAAAPKLVRIVGR